MPDEDIDRAIAVGCALDEFLDRLARVVVYELLGPESAAKARANSDLATPPVKNESAPMK